MKSVFTAQIASSRDKKTCSFPSTNASRRKKTRPCKDAIGSKACPALPVKGKGIGLPTQKSACKSTTIIKRTASFSLASASRMRDISGYCIFIVKIHHLPHFRAGSCGLIVLLREKNKIQEYFPGDLNRRSHFTFYGCRIPHAGASQSRRRSRSIRSSSAFAI